MSKHKHICNTKYPIVLVHGIGNRDYRRLNYWGDIPQTLKNYGAKVFYGNQEACQTIEINARILKRNIIKILKYTDCKKVNIIAHSKGGLETRYMIDKLNMADNVASLTTISTPHNGSKVIDIFCKLPELIYKLICKCIDIYFKLLGDRKPDSYDTIKQLSTSYCNRFNTDITNSNAVYYQSYTSAMTNPFSDIGMIFSYIVVYVLEGQNDGLVSVKSARWKNFKGVVYNNKIRGISHCDIVGSKRLNIAKIDVNKFYIGIVNDLKMRGL